MAAPCVEGGGNMIVDWTRPLDVLTYNTLHLIAEFFWFLNAFLLLLGAVVRQVFNWFSEHIVDIVPLINEPFGTLLAFTLLLATALYGLSRILNNFTDWRPVDIGKAFLYGTIGFFYLSSGLMLIQAIETIRDDLGIAISDATTSIFSDILNGLAYSGDGYVLGDPVDVDGRAGISGIDVAATYLGAANLNDLRGGDLPSGLRSGYPYRPAGLTDCCFMYEAAAFEQLDDAERSHALNAAAYGVKVLFMGLWLVPYAITSELVWFILTLAALVVFLSLPLGFVFSPFRSTQGILSSYIHQYIAIVKETVITAFFVGAGSAMILASLQTSLFLLWPVNIITSLILLWRVLSATKTLGTAISNTTSSFKPLQQSQQGMDLTGMAVGAGMAGVGLATGNVMLAKYGAMSGMGAMNRRSNLSSPMWWMMGGAKNLGGGGGGRGLKGDPPATGTTSQSPPVHRLSNNNNRAATPAITDNDQEGGGGYSQPATYPAGEHPLSRVQTRGRVSRATSAIRSWAQNDPDRLTEYKPNVFGVAGRRVKSLASTPETAEATESATSWMDGYIHELQVQGTSPKKITEDFRSGKAFSEAQKSLPSDSPFVTDESNFHALADMMMSEQRVPFKDIVGAIAHADVKEGRSPSKVASIGLGASDDFGGHNGIVNNIYSAAAHIGANQTMPGEAPFGKTYLEQSYEYLDSGKKEHATNFLNELAPDNPDGVQELLNHLEVGWDTMRNDTLIAPSVAYSPGNERTYNNSYLAQAEHTTGAHTPNTPSSSTPSVSVNEQEVTASRLGSNTGEMNKDENETVLTGSFKDVLEMPEDWKPSVSNDLPNTAVAPSPIPATQPRTQNKSSAPVAIPTTTPPANSPTQTKPVVATPQPSTQDRLKG